MVETCSPSEVGTTPVRRPVTWSLARKLSLALVSILFFTLAITAFFAHHKFERVYSGLVQSRYSFVVFTIQKGVEDSLNLGLALRQLRQVQGVIEREKARDGQIQAIEVFDAAGEILFATDRGAIGSAVPEPWRQSLGTGDSQPFSHSDEDAQVVGLPLVNILGKVEGGVALRYPRASLEGAAGELLLDIAKVAAAALAGFALLAVAGLYRLLGRVSRKLAAMEHTLDAVMAQGGRAEPSTPLDTFEEQFAEFVGKTREAVDHVQDATDEVERLDRLAG